jgi:hypothetical protein
MHIRPHTQAGYMTALDPMITTSKKPLPTGGRPYMTKQRDPAIDDHRITKGSAIGASDVLIHTVFVRV